MDRQQTGCWVRHSAGMQWVQEEKKETKNETEDRSNQGSWDIGHIPLLCLLSLSLSVPITGWPAVTVFVSIFVFITVCLILSLCPSLSRILIVSIHSSIYRQLD